MIENKIYDVAVVGAGPAGMTAAARAAELGAKVVLLEKNSTPGTKLLVTGKGRSNIAKAEFEAKELAGSYGREGNFLLYPLSVFGAKETIDFFESKGLKTKTERGKRVFPKSDKASDVLNVLIDHLKANKVKIRVNSAVQSFLENKGRIAKIILKDGEEVAAKNYILCTGGKAFPGTGSTGDGYKWARKLGHALVEAKPGLAPLRIKESWPKAAQGLSLKNTELTVMQNGKKKDSRFGELLFTHFGISGPIVLDLSNKIGELLEKGAVQLFLDLKPALDFQTLDKRIQSDFLKYSKKLFRNCLDDLLPQKLIPVIVKMSGISPEKKASEITREERHKLVRLLKGLEMTAASLLGFEMAIITRGGVSLKEIDSKTMKSKLIANLFFAGEIINLHGPTGGYNLQLCWTTGYLAGQSAAN